MVKIKLTTAYITLGQLLKDQNFVASGGAAKYFLADSNYVVKVNDEIEARRGRKLFSGDKVTITMPKQESVQLAID